MSPQVRRLFAVLTGCLLFALAGCGGSSPRSAAGHRCVPSDAFMQCQLQAPSHALGLIAPGAPLARGVDFAWGGPSVATMRANGWTFGASYLSYDGSKNFSPALINAYHAAGIHTVLVWETGATRATAGYAAGRSDAISAIAQANARGPWRVLYFAIDCDCSGGQVQSYFDGVRSVLPVSEIGAYGGYYPIHYLFDTHRIAYGWQTYAWSRGLWDGRAQLEQWLNGSSVDYDRAIAADYGQVPYAVPVPPAPKVNHHYAYFPTGPFPGKGSWRLRHPNFPRLLNERAVVRRYDRLIGHAYRNRYQLHVVRQELLFLRDRVYYLAHHAAHHGAGAAAFSRRPRWGANHYGFRFHVLAADTKGVRAV